MHCTKCQTDFSCLKTSFVEIKERKEDFPTESFIECHYKPDGCIYSISYGYSHLCSCPLAVYIVKNKVDANAN